MARAPTFKRGDWVTRIGRPGSRGSVVRAMVVTGLDGIRHEGKHVEVCWGPDNTETELVRNLRPAKETSVSRRRKQAASLTKIIVRLYRDSGQTVVYAEWSNGSRTEGPPSSAHMQALTERAAREKLPIVDEIW